MPVKEKLIETLLHLHSEHLSLAKQAETQLGQLNSMLIPVIAAATAYAAQLPSGSSGIIIGSVIALIAIYGYIACTKYLEAYWKQYQRAKYFALKIEKIYPEIEFSSIQDKGTEFIQKEFKLTRNISTVRLLQFLYVMSILIGLFFIINTIVQIAA